MNEDTAPIPIGILILGTWNTTKIPLEYLVLLLNSKQNLFEYQLLQLDNFSESMTRHFGIGSEQDVLMNNIKTGSEISHGKLKLKHLVNDIATALYREVNRSSDIFDQTQNPDFFIFITTSKHSDSNFFQDDGQNGFNMANRCRGAIIMTGHHKSHLSPPTVIEFVFKFIFRISIKWMYPEFVRKKRHYCAKSCLFDFNQSSGEHVRYLVLHNFICHSCRKTLGKDVAEQITSALSAENLYGDTIERHPAKISSELGFNLSLVKGLYKSKIQIMKENITTSFFSRIGSLFAFGILIGTFYATDTDSWFLGYIF